MSEHPERTHAYGKSYFACAPTRNVVPSRFPRASVDDDSDGKDRLLAREVARGIHRRPRRGALDCERGGHHGSMGCRVCAWEVRRGFRLGASGKKFGAATAREKDDGAPRSRSVSVEVRVTSASGADARCEADDRLRALAQ